MSAIYLLKYVLGSDRPFSMSLARRRNTTISNFKVGLWNVILPCFLKERKPGYLCMEEAALAGYGEWRHKVNCFGEWDNRTKYD